MWDKEQAGGGRRRPSPARLVPEPRPFLCYREWMMTTFTGQLLMCFPKGGGGHSGVKCPTRGLVQGTALGNSLYFSVKIKWGCEYPPSKVGVETKELVCVTLSKDRAL